MLENAESPIDVTPSPSVNFSNFVVESLFEENAFPPISPLSIVKSLTVVPKELLLHISAVHLPILSVVIGLLLNAEDPSDVTVFGIVKLLIWLLENVCEPIDVTLSGIVRLFIWLLENAESPIDVTLLGITSSPLIWLLENAELPIDVTPSPSDKFTIWLLENAESPTSPLSIVKSVIEFPKRESSHTSVVHLPILSVVIGLLLNA